MLFKNVMVGESQKRHLVSMVKNNRISHAQLFLGQPGNHTFALAIAYAQYINCENRGEWDSCGVCPSCAKYEKLSHPDLHLIFPNATNKSVKKEPDSTQFAQLFRDYVEQRHYHIDLESWLIELGGENKQASINIRDCAHIINQNSIRSYEGGYKIFLLWMVERLYYAAAPKLLKTLEEPENKTLFILMAESADNILPTILSRTQLIKIPRLAEEKIVQQLQQDYDTTPEIASDIAAISEGNYIKAMGSFEERGELKLMLQRFELLFRSIVNLSKSKDNSQIQFLDVQSMFGELISEGREAQKSFLRFVIRMLRNILLLGTKNDVVLNATSEEKKLMEFFRSDLTLRTISPLLTECNQAIYHTERNGNPALVFTDFYLKMARHLAPNP